MDKDVAIKIDGVSKYFSPSSGTGSLKSNFAGMFKSKKDKNDGGYWALKNVSFEVKKGEFFGIVGRNGSGKSTLLKMMAGIYTPTSGSIQINGKLVPFIELGVGFNHELSGRDNVFLNGALLGFNRKEMTDMYEEIVKFAELEDHMDVKLKNFSSGMQVRLAFSIAIRAKSDILLIDEVLAVGDALFQKKCFDYFRKLKKEKRTVLFVTHDMANIQEYCNRAVIIDEGIVKHIGTAREVSKTYNDEILDKIIASEISSINNEEQQISTDKFKYACSITNEDNLDCSVFDCGENIILNVRWSGVDEICNLGFGLFNSQDIKIFGSNTFIQKTKISNSHVSILINPKLEQGEYYFALVFCSEDDSKIVRHIPKVGVFRVRSHEDTSRPYNNRWDGLIHIKSSFQSGHYNKTKSII